MPKNLEGQASFADYLGQISDPGRKMIIPALLEVQSHFEFVSAETTREIGEALGVSLADITGVIEFNSMLYDHRIARNSTDFTTWLRSILGCSIQMGEFLS